MAQLPGLRQRPVGSNPFGEAKQQAQTGVRFMPDLTRRTQMNPEDLHTNNCTILGQNKDYWCNPPHDRDYGGIYCVDARSKYDDKCTNKMEIYAGIAGGIGGLICCCVTLYFCRKPIGACCDATCDFVSGCCKPKATTPAQVQIAPPPQQTMGEPVAPTIGAAIGTGVLEIRVGERPADNSGAPKHDASKTTPTLVSPRNPVIPETL